MVNDVPFHVTLDDPTATDPELTGGKAAALAVARAAGIDTLPGIVLTSRYGAAADAGADVDDATRAAHRLAAAIVPGDTLIARSSSVVEDQSESSAAGQFESVAGISSYDDFRRAVATVLDSRDTAGAPGSAIGVLVQPQVEPDAAGVVFGIEPVTGRTDRLVVAAVRGRPDRLVGGEVEGSRFTVDREGRTIESTIGRDADDRIELDDATLRALVHVATRLAEVFGAPQDVEWALVDGDVVVLQSRPVTTPVRGVPSGPRYGPGTVAETFPDPLGALERDLWVPPLDEAVRAALVLSGRHTDDELADRPLVITVGGRVAIDLDATGEDGRDDRSWVVRRVRALRNAWRLGRLRAALPSLVDDLLDRVDADLAAMPSPDELGPSRSLAVLRRSHAALRSLHAHEVLVGAMSPSAPSSLTAASVAVRSLDSGRREGLDDDTIVARAPVVLALTPPRIAASPRLPPEIAVPARDEPDGDEDVRREALRLRVRWLHELTARLAWALGEDLARHGDLPDAEAIRHLPLDDLEAILARRAAAWRAAIESAGSQPPAEQLPSAFRLSDRGLPVPEVDASGDAVGASPGTATGVAVHVDEQLDERLDEIRRSGDRAIVVVRALSPDLGGRLGSVAGIVAESGSTLSHLAILAREQGVPVVVSCPGAVDRFAAGTRLTIDGSDGTVEIEGDT